MNDHKEHSRIRRQRKVEAMRDGWPYFDRTVPSRPKYERKPKYRPQTAYEWEELED